MTAAPAIGLLVCCAQPACLAAPPSAAEPGHSVQFFGHPYQDNGIDRVWILAERPNPAGRLGRDNFTIELWLKAEAAGVGEVTSCPAQWWQGTIVLDREFFNAPLNGNVGISLYRIGAVTGVAVGFAVIDVGEVNLCGDAEVADGEWHHVAMTRDLDNLIAIWVDGDLDETGLGPVGDGSFADDLGPDIDSADPFMVLGGPKQDESSAPGFTGLIDDLRLSDDDLYDGPFDPPYPPLALDPDDTLALWRFDEGEGDATLQLAGEGAGDGELRVGGDPLGPIWSDDVPVPE